MCFEAYLAFTHVTVCLLAESPEATLSIEGFGSFVTSATAPIATGWSNSCQVGLTPTEERRLCTAHGHREYTNSWTASAGQARTSSQASRIFSPASARADRSAAIL